MGMWEFRQFLLVLVFQITPKCSSLKQQTFVLCGQEFRCPSAVWFWIRMSPEVSVRMLARAAVI